MQGNTKWWLEPITWQQAEAIAKHYKMDKDEVKLVYPTKGEAVGAIKASFFKQALRYAVSDAMSGKLTSFEQLRGYFIDDSDGGQNNLGKRNINEVWRYVERYVRK